jgi:hypothetical protein
MTLADLLSRFDNVTPRGRRSLVTCKSHEDKNPSLSISEGERGLLLKCWAGCSLIEICQSIGIEQRDLFFDAPTSRGQRPTPKTPRLDRIALAFRWDLAALDLRLRAEKIIEAGKTLDVVSLNDDDLDRAIEHAALAYADCDRAELFEGVADDLRMKEFRERDHAQHQRVA